MIRCAKDGGIYGPGSCRKGSSCSGVTKDCEHISGLEVEGLHPPALMVRAGLPCNRSSAFKGPSPRQRFQTSRSRRFCHHSNHPCSPVRTFALLPRRRGSTVRHAPDDPSVFVRYRNASLRCTQLALFFGDPSTATVFVRREVHDRSRAMNQ